MMDKMITEPMNSMKIKLQGGQFAVFIASMYHPINFALTARIRGAFTPDQFHQALEKLRTRYPPLSMRVTREPDGQIYLISDPNLEIPVFIREREHSESWVEVVTTELDQDFDMVHHPPLRLIWLRGEAVSEVIFVSPHALADGYSVAYLVRDFLAFLSAPEAKVEPMPPAPAMSALIPDFPGKRRVIWQAKLRSMFIKILLSFSPKQGPQTWAEANAIQPKYSLRPWVLTREQTTALVARSRSERTTVHAALCTAFLRAFGDYYGNGWKRKIQSPVSLRERLTSPVGETFGLYVNLAKTWANCAPERDFWEVAREIKQKFIQCTGDRYIFNTLTEGNVVIGAIGKIITPKLMMQSTLNIGYDLSITNLGRLDFPVQYETLQLEALFGPTLGGHPEDIVLGVLTIGDIMHFTLSFTDVKMKKNQADQIITKAMDGLAEAAGWE